MRRDTTNEGNILHDEAFMDLWSTLDSYLEATESGRKRRDTTNEDNSLHDEAFVDLLLALDTYLEATESGRK